MSKLGGKPLLSPDMPIEDRMAVALFYRLLVDTKRLHDRPGTIRAQKALDSAKRAALEALREARRKP